LEVTRSGSRLGDAGFATALNFPVVDALGIGWILYIASSGWWRDGDGEEREAEMEDLAIDPFSVLRDRELLKVLSCVEFHFEDRTGKNKVDALGLGAGDGFGDVEGEGVLLRERLGKGNN
jgi:hypothetical protein